MKYHFLLLFFLCISCKPDIYEQALINELEKDLKSYKIDEEQHEIHFANAGWPNEEAKKIMLKIDPSLNDLHQFDNKTIKQKIVTMNTHYPGNSDLNTIAHLNYYNAPQPLTRLYLKRNIEFLRSYLRKAIRMPRQIYCGFQLNTRVTLRHETEEKSTFRFYNFSEFPMVRDQDSVALKISNDSNKFIAFSDFKWIDNSVLSFDIKTVSSPKHLELFGTIFQQHDDRALIKPYKNFNLQYQIHE